MTSRGPLWLLATGVLFVLIVPALAQGASAPSGSSLALGASGGASGGASHAPSAVFTMTNNATGNAIVAYRLGVGGAIIPAGSYATHGRGSGTSLADQGALALTANHAWLLAVDAGSNDVSVFRVHLNGHGPLLSFSDRVRSGGVAPVSLAVHGALVYVLNAGNSTRSGDIAGFYLTGSGLLLPLRGSQRALSTSAATGPAQIAFSPSGASLIVTEKSTSLIDSYAVGPRGYASTVSTTASSGAVPYGFAFAPSGTLVVSEAGPGALSSYAVGPGGSVTVISASITDNQSAPCWVVITASGSFAYTTNAHSNSISSYQLAASGGLTLLASVAATTGAAPTDMALAGAHSGHLLVYDAGAGEIDEYAVSANGSLSAVASVYGLPSTSEGLVAF